MITWGDLRRFLPAIIIALSTFFSISYSTGPIFESPDELQHYYYIRQIASGVGLPDGYYITNPRLSGEWFEPPLYYALGAPIKSAIADDDFDELGSMLNPFHRNLIRRFTKDAPPPVGNDNKNFYLHTAREKFPYTTSGTALAVHVLRLYSVLLSVVTLIFTYLCLQSLWPDRPALAVTGLAVVAFWPLRAYMSGTINSDNIVALTATISLYLILRLVRVGSSWQVSSLLGLFLGLSLLSKVNGVLLLAPYGVAVALDWKRQRRYLVLTLVIMLIVGGWWYIRNLIWYGELYSFSLMPTFIHTTAGIGTGRVKWADIPDRMLLTYQRFWASFNHDGTVPVGNELSALYDVLTVLGLTGAIFGLLQWVRKRHGRIPPREQLIQVALLATYFATLIVGVAYVTLNFSFATQPRYFVPGAVIVGALLAYGWDTLTPQQFRFRVGLSSVALTAVMSCYALAGYFLPVYLPLPAPAEIGHRLDLRYEDSLILLGTAADTIVAHPGDSITVILYWEAVAPGDSMNYVVWTRTRDAELFFAMTYPGNGHLLASDMKPGERWSERYHFKIPADAKPGSYPLTVRYLGLSPARGLWATAPDGTRDLSPVIMTLIVK